MKHRTLLLGLALFLAGPASAVAQKPRAEIGFRGGLSVYRYADQNRTVLSFPGDSYFSVHTMHATMFATPSLAIEPQAGIVRISVAGSSSGLFAGGLQVNQFVGAAEQGAPFGFINGVFMKPFNGGDGEVAAGGGAGYRLILAENLGVRLEGRYRRWFRTERNEFSLLVGMGAVLGRRE